MILRSSARFKLLACGRRWAKTAAGLLAILRGHGEGRFKGAVHGGRYWWMGPSDQTIADSFVWDDLKRATRPAGAQISESEMTITLPNQATISVRSAGSLAAGRGPGLDGVILDEAARTPPEVWREGLRPALADRQGWAMHLTSPNGKNWWYKLFSDAKTLPDWETWQRPSSDNPLMTAGELAQLERELGPRSFLQEHGAVFTDVGGAIFNGDYFEDARIFAAPGEWPSVFEMSVIAIDPSLGRHARTGDYSAIVFVGFARGQYWVFPSMDRRAPRQIVADTMRMNAKFRPLIIGIESNGFQEVLGDVFAYYCREQNIPMPGIVMVNNSDPKIRIQALDPHLHAKRIRFWKCEASNKVIEQLQMFPDPAFHDDGPDALEMGLRLIQQLHANAQVSTDESEHDEVIF